MLRRHNIEPADIISFARTCAQGEFRVEYTGPVVSSLTGTATFAFERDNEGETLLSVRLSPISAEDDSKPSVYLRSVRPVTPAVGSYSITDEPNAKTFSATLNYDTPAGPLPWIRSEQGLIVVEHVTADLIQAGFFFYGVAMHSVESLPVESKAQVRGVFSAVRV
jgi:hypothetical protein